MRDYGKVSPGFWTGETGRAIIKSGPEATIVALYLMTSPHANMLGLYYLPITYLAHDTGLTLQGASKGLRRVSEGGLCGYDEEKEVVWVYEMARYQVDEYLKEGDKRIIGIRKEYERLPKCKFLGAFFDKYKDAFHLEKRRGFEGASKGLRSQEQEQEQDILEDSSLRSESSCSDLSGETSEQQADDQEERHDPVLMRIPLNIKDTFFDVKQSDVDDWQESFPGIDVVSELKKCRQWSVVNEKKRKTKGGIKKHIVGWLGKAQDRGGNFGPPPIRRSMTARQQYMSDVASMMEVIDGLEGRGCAEGSCGNGRALAGSGTQRGDDIEAGD